MSKRITMYTYHILPMIKISPGNILNNNCSRGYNYLWALNNIVWNRTLTSALSIPIMTIPNFLFDSILLGYAGMFFNKQ